MRSAMFVVCVACVAMVGCKEPASDAQLDQMCRNLAKVRGEAEIPDLAAAQKKIEQEFADKQQRLLARKKADLEALDAELQQKIAAIDEKDPEKEATVQALQKEYKEKKEIAAANYDKDLAAIPTQKKAALDAERARVEEKKAALEEAVKACIADAKKEGVDVELAQCRINAPDKDTYWNKCR